ncbi:SAG family member [Eimeria praecox]|uniref:SAG family member n=1 Tax=Eimeria praecox TaxID=51316 RepID=U6G1L3_9EIME|nr:SAG family member [Eimeria praecox]
MAPIYLTVAASLLAVTGLESVVADTSVKFTVVDVQGDAYTSANLARGGKLSVGVKTLAENAELITALKTKLGESTAVTGTACDGSMQIGPTLKEIFHAGFTYPQAGSSPNYREIIQKTLDSGIKVLKEKSPYGSTNGQWTTFWEDEDGANIANLLGANSTQIGCAIGRCTTVDTAQPKQVTVTNRAVLFCAIDPPTRKDTAPFDKQYYDALVGRTTPLADMTPDDLKASRGGSTVAVPSVLLAGMAAILAAVALCIHCQLPVRINALTTDETLVTNLKQALTEAPSKVTGPSCAALDVAETFEKTKFYVTFTKESGKTPNYRQMVENAINNGLILMQTYPTTDQEWKNFWGQPGGANMANLLWANSTTIGCAVLVCTEAEDSGTAQTADRAILFCQMNPEPQQDKPPFSKDYYEALSQRETSLVDMTPDDLKASKGGSAVAVPSVLLAGISAIIAAVAL